MSLYPAVYGVIAGSRRTGAEPIVAGLLDPYTTGMTSACGIKRLITNSTYTGPAIRVRKSTGADTTTEQDIGFAFGLTALNVALLLSFAGSESAVIVRAYDQWASNHYDPIGTANQPRIVNAGVYDAGCFFDGSNDNLRCINAMAVTRKKAIVVRRSVRSYAGVLWSYGDHTQLGINCKFSQFFLGNGTAYIFDQHSSTDYSFVGVTTFTGGGSTAHTDMHCLDPQSGAARSAIQWFEDGGSMSLVEDSFGDSGTGSGATDFTAEPWVVGGYSDAGQPAAATVSWWATWDGDKTAQAAAISALT